MAHQTPDQMAKQMGFPSAAAMIAWQNKQQQIQNAPAQAVQTAHPQAPPPTQAEGLLQHILNLLPLGSAMKKAGDAMGK